MLHNYTGIFESCLYRFGDLAVCLNMTRSVWCGQSFLKTSGDDGGEEGGVVAYIMRGGVSKIALALCQSNTET